MSSFNFVQINACNGFYCDTFTPNKAYKPTMWTEAWSGWYLSSFTLFSIILPYNIYTIYMIFYDFYNKKCRFTEFGGTVKQRPAEDLAYAVARFIQKGGSFVNYYMVSG